MIISKEKRKENIAEYLLYMWQIEDLIRGCELDLDKIKKSVIDKYTLPDEDKKKMEDWYAGLIEMMRTEGCTEKGHLQVNKNVIIRLAELHEELLKSPKTPQYGAVFFKTLPYIVELRKKQGENKVGEIETCFNFLYGILMLKLSGKEITQSTAEAVKQISAFIAVLAAMFKQYEAGTLEL